MEMDEEKILSRKRMEKWIKIFLAFLAFVWLCTIISKSIYVSGLTIVKTDTPSKKYVEHRVETDGIVTTGGEIAVNAQAGLRVDKIYVMQGDEVRAGDVLFTIDQADLSNIISEKETDLSKIQYNLSDLQVNAVIDSQKKEVSILWAQEDYDTADKETAVAKERAKEALDKAEAELGKHLADMAPYTSDSARQSAWNAYHDWVNRGYSISDKITAKEREIQDLEEELAGLEKTTTGGNVLSGAAGSREEAVTDESQDNESGIQANEEAVETEETEEDSSTSAAPEQNREDEENQVQEIEAKRIELQNKIRKANEELLALRDELTKHDREAVAQPDYSAEEVKYDAWQSTRLTLEANVQSAKQNYNDVSYAREVTLRQKMRDIANAQVTTRADSTAAIYELDIKQLRNELDNLHTLQKQNGEIKAQADGVVSAVRVEVGGRTSDTAAVLLTDTQRPCQFSFSITKEQGKYVHLNDTVELKLSGQTSAMEVTVDYFAENTQGGYDIICMLPVGVGKIGLSGSIQKSVQGEYHDLVLPADAVYEESGSYYIYTLNEKEGILGSEYYVEKLKVQVKDRNDRYAALEAGTIGADTKVVTYATKELKQGESVRPQEK